MSQDMGEGFKKYDDSLGASPSASDTEQMLKSSVQRGAERFEAARGKLREQWAVAKQDLDQFKQRAMDYSQTAAKATNTYAHDHPWRTAGAAVGVGALLGWLITRRWDTSHHHRY